jgi:hypothetical protein
MKDVQTICIKLKLAVIEQDEDAIATLSAIGIKLLMKLLMFKLLL